MEIYKKIEIPILLIIKSPQVIWLKEIVHLVIK